MLCLVPNRDGRLVDPALTQEVALLIRLGRGLGAEDEACVAIVDSLESPAVVVGVCGAIWILALREKP